MAETLFKRRSVGADLQLMRLPLGGLLLAAAVAIMQALRLEDSALGGLAVKLTFPADLSRNEAAARSI